ncbi:phosphoglycolate phosphatase [Pseudomonas sp. MM211]|uniref:phosphoglycolate phosphatase n=1 Tax=Pseudomonas sp. MM211 TaxID=2866808 RepID=UPI001CECFBBE|nr:phosphoglycolate phosphatase [Pseudomonas sp. MM211]UCJ18276.1 phosphoglycolate phosphatase [Pseudomonas sp. MM211]
MKPLRALCAGELPRLVMFDLDGTLVDSVPDLATAVDRMLTELGREPAGVERVRTWVGNGARVLVRRALAGSIEHAVVSDAETDVALARFLDIYADCHELITLYPGVHELLEALSTAAVELAVVTNKPERFVAPLLEQVGLGGYFRWIIGGDTLPQQKPDPAALLQVMHLAGVTAAQSLFIGDSRSDVLAARAASVPCVAVSYGYNHGRPIAEEEPQRVVDSLAELL